MAHAAASFMSWTRLLLGCAVSSSLLGAMPARADDCKGLALLTSLDMTTARGITTIPVTINGTPQKFLLATAGGRSSINQNTAAALGLNPIDTPFAARLVNSRTAKSTSAYVTVKSFTLGAMHAQDLSFVVTPGPQAGTNSGPPFDGQLAPDLMSRNDVELDFAAGKLNYFSQDHCEGHVIYWPNSGEVAVPFQMTRPGVTAQTDSHIRVQVTVDGKPFVATINTAETRSTMTADVAKGQFDITADSPGSVPRGTADGDPEDKMFSHVFHTLSFGGINVANPEMVIVPNLVGNKLTDTIDSSGERTTRFDNPNLVSQVTIGMDVLRKLHLYIAFQERKLYITAAAAAAPAQPATAQ